MEKLLLALTLSLTFSAYAYSEKCFELISHSAPSVDQPFSSIYAKTTSSNEASGHYQISFQLKGVDLPVRSYFVADANGDAKRERVLHYDDGPDLVGEMFIKENRGSLDIEPKDMNLVFCDGFRDTGAYCFADESYDPNKLGKEKSLELTRTEGNPFNPRFTLQLMQDCPSS